MRAFANVTQMYVSQNTISIDLDIFTHTAVHSVPLYDIESVCISTVK